MVKWKDTSSFSRDDKDRTPREWTAKVGMFRLTVHHHIHYEPSAWLLSTVPDLFERRELDSTEIEEAKAQALSLVRAACQLTIDAIANDPEKCQGCKRESAAELHTCPFKDEIHGDVETLCNCCPECSRECAMDI